MGILALEHAGVAPSVEAFIELEAPQQEATDYLVDEGKALELGQTAGVGLGAVKSHQLELQIVSE